jgi:hypothetical protein
MEGMSARIRIKAVPTDEQPQHSIGSSSVRELKYIQVSNNKNLEDGQRIAWNKIVASKSTGIDKNGVGLRKLLSVHLEHWDAS